MAILESLQSNLLSPIALAFVLGLVARALQSDLKLPEQLTQSLSIYLLLAIGLKGGVELAHASFVTIAAPAAVTLLLGCLTPISSYWVLRRLCRFESPDAAGIAAHYGSVSAVTFIAAGQFAAAMKAPVEGFMPTLVTLLEGPGIFVALSIGAVQTALASRTTSIQGSGAIGLFPRSGSFGSLGLADEGMAAIRDVLTGRTMFLMVGGMLVGYLIGDRGYASISPFFESGFKGALTLFLLEMGLVAGARLGDLKTAGPALVVFGIAMPIIHGTAGVLLGHWAGLSVGGSAVLGAMVGSASYIAAPPAVKMTLPEANPTLSLTAALAITFPFNLLIGIPLYYQIANWLA